VAARGSKGRYFDGSKTYRIVPGTLSRSHSEAGPGRRHDIRSQVANGEDPAEKRKAAKRRLGMIFELVAREWWGKRKHLWKGKYGEVILTRLEKDIFPYIGDRPIHKLDAADFLECFERMEKRGVLETAHKVKTKCSEVMRSCVTRSPHVELNAIPSSI
jgi:hypothetical protein